MRTPGPEAVACTPFLKPTQTKANQDKKMIRLRKLPLILGMTAPPDDDAGSKNLFLKLYRK